MLLLTRFNGTQIYINAELIKTIEETPNTVITLMDHTKIVVTETAAAVVEMYIDYRRKIMRPLEIPNSLRSVSVEVS